MVGPERVNADERAESGSGGLARLANPVATKLRDILDGALTIQRPAVEAHVERLKRRLPDAPPERLVAELEKQYLAAVGTLGAAAGGAAAVPGIGSTTALAFSVAEIGSFVDATVLFTLAVAEVHGVEVRDLARRRALVLAVLLGNSGSAIVEKAAGRTGAHWGKLLVQGMPMDKIVMVNRLLGRNFITKYSSKQGVLVLGRVLPMGIGAAIGASGNAALGYASVRAARRAFGAPMATVTQIATAVRLDQVSAPEPTASAVTDERDPVTDERSERSFAAFTDEHLARLGELATADHDKFTRADGRPEYADRRLAVVLAEGAAMHYLGIDGHGVQDLDVWTFYAAIPGARFPAIQRETHADFGASEFGRNQYDFASASGAEAARYRRFDGYQGRRVDFLTRALPVPPDASEEAVLEAIREWLRQGQKLEGTKPTAATHLAREAMIMIEPQPLRGATVWGPEDH